MENTLTHSQTINAYKYALNHLTFAKKALEHRKIANEHRKIENGPGMKLTELRLKDIQNEIPLYQNILDQYENKRDTLENELTDNQQRSAYWYALRYLASVKEELEKRKESNEHIQDVKNEMKLYTDQLGIEEIKDETDLYRRLTAQYVNKETSP